MATMGGDPNIDPMDCAVCELSLDAHLLDSVKAARKHFPQFTRQRLLVMWVRDFHERGHRD